ncbi:Vacuolar protein sorting-associated protein 13, variant 2 [Naganishia albida]|nr:Vacuolar protein sorting-associated protein 13, variant 2 [Naganishia albida]
MAQAIRKVVTRLINGFVAPYIENLTDRDLQFSLVSGSLALKDLQIKREALDALNLPVEVHKGLIGQLNIYIPLTTLGSEPIRFVIEDVFLLVKMKKASGDVDLAEEERKLQKVKQDQLRQLEAKEAAAKEALAAEKQGQQKQGWMDWLGVSSVAEKAAGNVQASIKNIHIRYEDDSSIPEHPFAAGITLSSFELLSADENWVEGFVKQVLDATRKVARMDSLSVYVDSDAPSIIRDGLDSIDTWKMFEGMISRKDREAEHRYVVRPIAGDARVIMRKRPTTDSAKLDVNIAFDEIGIVLEDEQWRDASGVIELFHYYQRTSLYHKYRPTLLEMQENRGKARWKLAKAILHEIHEKKRRWTWNYMAQRRDDRKTYVEIYSRTVSANKPLAGEDLEIITKLELDLSFEDIRWFRKLAKRKAREQRVTKPRTEDAQIAAAQEQQKVPGGWMSWVWGSGQSAATNGEPGPDDELTEADRQEVHSLLEEDEDVLDYTDMAPDTILNRIHATLGKGSFALRSNKYGRNRNMIALVFDQLSANVLQMPSTLDATVALGGFSVSDGTTPDTLHPQIVRVKEKASISRVESAVGQDALQHQNDPFFVVRYEQNPLDRRADIGISAKMRHLEIVYHRGYVEAVSTFFRNASELESVNALIAAAGQSFEGLRQGTRAGLEYALERHKTMDVQIDMDAPIIIVPERMDSLNSLHLVLDAGHIAVESALADQKEVQSVQSKRGQALEGDDYIRLQSLMYDKFSLKLESTQLLIGNSWDSCMSALGEQVNGSSKLHIVEKIGMDFMIQNAILNVPELTKLKVSGQLPRLHVNLSDTKYKSLMRLIDIAIPKSEEPPADDVAAKAPPRSSEFPPANEPQDFDDGASFLTDATDLRRDDDGDFHDAVGENNDNQGLQYKQKTFELEFAVGELRASLSRSVPNAEDRQLATAAFNGFALDLAIRQYDMSVNLGLKTLSLDMLQPNETRQPVVVTLLEEEDELVRVKYARVQQESPEYMPVYDGIDQSIDTSISTLRLHIEPEPLISLYDFIMTTFVPEHPIEENQQAQVEEQETTNEKLRIRVRLTGVQLSLLNDSQQFATLALTTADVALLLRGGTMRLGASIGNISFKDELSSDGSSSFEREILTIEGHDLANLTYETYDPADPETFPGYNSFVKLRSGSLRLFVSPQPLQHLMAFSTKLARLKAVYDAASQAAMQRAAEVVRMRYDVEVKTPILVLPGLDKDCRPGNDRVIVRLGQVSAKNEYFKDRPTASAIDASLTGISVMSESLEAQDTMPILADVDLRARINQSGAEQSSPEGAKPNDTEIVGQSNGIVMTLTQSQYRLLMALLRDLPASLSNSQESQPPVETVDKNASVLPIEKDMLDASEAANNGNPASLMSVKFDVPNIRLELFDAKATSKAKLEGHSIIRFEIDNVESSYQQRSDGQQVADVKLAAVTLSNTRPGASLYRDFLPKSTSPESQIHVKYEVEAGSNPASSVTLDINGPRFILAADPLYALMDFAILDDDDQAERDAVTEDDRVAASSFDKQPTATAQSSNNMAIQLNVNDASVLLLASDSVKNSGLIELRIAQMVLTKQHNLTFAIQQLGMFFGHIDDPSDRSRFLDDVNITLGYSIDDGGSSGTHIALGVQTIVFRASYGDLLLITDVANKAIALASRQNPQADLEDLDNTVAKQERRASKARRSTVTRRPEIRVPGDDKAPTGPKLTKVSTEILDASFGGFQLVLIGDVHELPVIHLHTPAFICKAKDWSGDLNANVVFKPSINYYNLKNSHWEPLLDPWEFGISAKTKAYPNGTKNTKVSLYSDRRLEWNMTAAFIELAITSTTVLARKEEKIRQGIDVHDTPFVVRNLTGRNLLVRNDVGHDSRIKTSTKAHSQRLADGESTPWRFQDIKQQRENISAVSRNAFAVTVENMQWDEVRGISVEREGESLFLLSPAIHDTRYHLACETTLRDNVKYITFRSTFVIENETHLPLEAKLLDSANKLSRATYSIQPGDKWPLPLEAVMHSRVILRPIGGYSWPTTAFGWRDLIRNPVRALTCKHESDHEAPFRCQAAAIFDKKDPLTRAYPRMKLRVRAPVEIENLLPYNIRYRVYDKHLGTNTTNFLIKGGISPIHTVNLSHLLMLSVLVQDSGFKQSDFAIINTDDPDDFRVENEISLKDNRNAELKLKLHYYKYPDSGGAFKVILYSPYVVINKTGLPFDMAFKNWSGTPGEIAGHERFRMFSYPKEDRGNRMFIRVGDSDWSEPVSFEGVGADSQIKFGADRGRSEYQIGMSYAEGMGKYKLSKAITLAPRYVIVNNYRKSLQVRQHRTENYQEVQQGEKVYWHTFKKTASEQLSLGLAGTGTRWSAPIDIANVGKTYLLLPQLNGAGYPSLLRIECRLQDATIFLFIHEETDQWPIQVRNETNMRMKFKQTEDTQYTPPPQDRQYEDLPGFSTIPFSWDYPAARDKKIRLAVGGIERDIDVMEIGILPPWKIPRQGANGAAGVLSIDVRTEGQSQVLVISRYDEQNSIYKPARPTMQRADSVDGSSSAAFETIETQEQPSLTVEVRLEGVGLSVVNKNLQELMYLSFRGLKMVYNNYETSYDASVDCGWIQIDNQLFGGLYPIILYPTIQPKDSKELEARPTLQAAITVLRDDQHGVFYIKYASILLQMITVELDEDFLFALYDFSKFENASWEEPVPDVLFDNPVDIPEPPPAAPGTNIYFELLALQPTQIDISFMRTERVNVDKKPSTRNPLVFFLNALTMALGNINGAPLRLNALFLENARVTWPSLQERLVLHYQEQIISQLYRVLGSADFLGNPVGLLNNVSSGFTDIFYEPYQGIVMHGGKELGVGLARGASSFAKKLTYGFSDSFSKVTGSIGKGISAAALDTEWQARRRMALRRNKPKHALYGIANGANVFASSVASGFEGLALKPLEGAEAGGVGGFFKGVGKGFVGAIAKPVAGVFDFASNVSEGIRNTTTVFDAEGLDRARYPRFPGSNGVLEPFNEDKALGQFWLKDLEHGKFFNETYIAHVHLNREDSAIIVTRTRILCIILSKMQLRWEIPFDDLKTIIMDTGGIGLVMQDDVNGPFIPLPEKAQKGFLFGALSNVIKAHNNERELANISLGSSRSR